MKRLRLNQVGDTIIEVMLATAILSVVLAGAFTISNKATRINQAAKERTEVSNLMQSQVELIRAKYKLQRETFWSGVPTATPPITGVDNYSKTGENTTYCATTTPSPVAGFYVKDDLSFMPAPLDGTGKKVEDGDTSDFYNVWVEAVDDASSKYTDFFVYACWEGIGGEGLQRSGLVMRISR